MKYIFIGFALILGLNSNAQAKLEGYVGDPETGSPFVGVSIFIDDLFKTKTDNSGFFVLETTSGLHEIKLTKEGLIDKKEKINVGTIDFYETVMKKGQNPRPISPVVETVAAVGDTIKLDSLDNPVPQVVQTARDSVVLDSLGNSINIKIYNDAAYAVKDSIVLDSLGNPIAIYTTREPIDLDSFAKSDSVQIQPIVEQTTTEPINPNGAALVIRRRDDGSEAAALQDQKTASVQKQNVGSQELSRKGAGDVEAGLTKVSGVSKVDSRGLFVRGLEDRYNNLLLNGLAIPSENPFNKVIDLSKFPTSVVGNLEIFKNFNPSLYADFGGATFNIETSQPNEKETSISLGLSANTISNFKTFLVEKNYGGLDDQLGLTLGDRKIPSFLGSVPSNYILSAEEGQKFNYDYDVKNINNNFNKSFSFSHADGFKLGSNKLKYLVTANFDNEFKFREGQQNSFLPSGAFNNNFRFTTQSYDTQFSGLAVVKTEGRKYDLTVLNLLLQSTENKIQDQFGSFNQGIGGGDQQFRRTLEFTNNLLNTSQILFNNKFGENDKYNLEAGLAYNRVFYDLPDRRILRGIVLPSGELQTSFQGSSQLRQFVDIDGERPSAFAKISTKLRKGESGEWSDKLTFGLNTYLDQYRSVFRVVGNQNGLSSSDEVLLDLFSPSAVINSAIQNGDMVLQETSDSQYKSILQQKVGATFFNYQFVPNKDWDINVGARLEYSERTIGFNTSGGFSKQLTLSTKDQTDILGSLAVKYAASRQSNIRFSFSNSITRPALMETIPLRLINADATAFVGNPNLENSKNYNLDLKYEIFPNAGELAAVTFYSKYIDQPIESTIVATSSSEGQNFSFTNSDNAVLMGVELDLVKKVPNLENLFFGLSGTLQASRVVVGAQNSFLTNDDRPLQGASPWIVNTDLKYENSFGRNYKTSATLAYNVYGERIAYVGAALLDDIYENPFHQLDLIWQNEFGKNFSVKVSAKNILDAQYSSEIGGEGVPIIEDTRIINSYRRGTTFSIGAKYKF